MYQHSRSVPVVSIVGRSNSGKTTLVEKLICELKKRGKKVGTIKHHAHNDMEVDKPGKDTWRFTQAGANAVALISSHKMFLLRSDDSEMPLRAAVEMLGQVDVVLTEGYRWEEMPKVEVIREANDAELLCSPDELIAIVSDIRFDVGIPCFKLDDISELSNLIEKQIERLRTSGEIFRSNRMLK